MSRLPFQKDSFAAIFSLFTAFGYFGPLPDNAHVIKEISRLLGCGGLWYFDYFDCDRVKAELSHGQPVSRSRGEGPLEIEEVRILNAEGNVVRKSVTMNIVSGKENEAKCWGVPRNGLNYTEEVAVFSQEAIVKLAGKHGLQPVATAGSYDGVPLGEGDRWLMIFRKATS